MRHTALRSTGLHVPPIEVSNDALRARFAESAPGYIDKMEATTGIRTRWYAPDDWATSDLAVEAARVALDRAGIGPDDIDLLLVGTQDLLLSRALGRGDAMRRRSRAGARSHSRAPAPPMSGWTGSAGSRPVCSTRGCM